ncbi:MAG: RluA family pseudouridine synthase [Phaeodactylibacter sp.]|nr:RluA family pseudouridine synthase [Phaeodactylibacter sp.]MCB9303914.1 RluA family pseudouridine synthase [Lewinellaceae bacterium]
MQDNYSDDYFDYQVIQVDRKQSSIRIDKFLMDRLERTSRNRVQNAIRSGAIRVDGKEIKPNYKIRPGEEISVVIPRPPGDGGGVLPQEIPLNILYEDEDLLVLHKPAGMVVHPGIGHHRNTLVNALAYHFGEQNLPVMDNNQSDRLGLVHRIDKNTSGLLVVAKSDYAMTHLAKQFYYHTVERTYHALVWGEPEADEGTVIANVGRHPRFRQKFTTFPEGDAGKWAVTHYKVLERLYYVSLIQCNLETGRTHQIRVHMESLGHPLFNDERYGGDRIVKGTVFSKYKTFVENTFTVMPRHALHAKSLGFIHPRTGKEMYFESELPSDFQEALERWRRYVAGRKATTNNEFD